MSLCVAFGGKYTVAVCACGPGVTLICGSVKTYQPNDGSDSMRFIPYCAPNAAATFGEVNGVSLITAWFLAGSTATPRMLVCGVHVDLAGACC